LAGACFISCCEVSMSEGGACPACGTRDTSFVEGRLCAACLLRLALPEAEGQAGEAEVSGASPHAEDRYGVRAVMDDCPIATAYLAEDSLSGRLVRLEIAKRPASIVPAALDARIRRRGDPGSGDGRLLDVGMTDDGRAWVVAARDAVPRGERRWLLVELGFEPNA
jgi:hypothetical protein